MSFYNQELMNLSEEEELELWIAFKKSQDQTLKDKLILKYLPLVKYVAGKVAIGMPKKIEFDDLEGYGVIGLLDAIDKFDPNRNTKFKTYGITRIRGAIFDELRAIDWIPRTIRQNVKKLEKAMFDLEEQLNRAPTDQEIAEVLEITDKELQKLFLAASTLTVGSVQDSIIGDDPDNEKYAIINVIEASGEYDPEVISEKNEIKKMISLAIEELPEKERQVLILYYYEDLTLKEIGEVLEVTESRVSQLHTKAILKLKAKIKKLQKKLEKSS